MAKKAHYEFVPIIERNIFYGSDLTALRKLITQYFRSDDIDMEDSFYSTHNAPSRGFAVPLSLRKNPEKQVGFVMFVREDSDIGTVAHEATHVCSQIFTYLGQLSDEWNDEIQAYMTGHFTKTFMEEIRGEKKEHRTLVKNSFKKNIERS